MGQVGRGLCVCLRHLPPAPCPLPRFPYSSSNTIFFGWNFGATRSHGVLGRSR